MFHHFDSKTELIQGVYEYCKAKRVASIELGDNGHSLEQRFKNLFLGRVEWGMSNLTAFTYLARFEKSSFSDAVPTDDQALNDLISEGQMNRKLRLIDEQILRYSVDSLLDSFAAYYSQNPAKHKDQLHLYTSFDFFWTAIKY
ncbi:MAG: AcrR family transcriptional regulator [Gammaproteobacteria bacterium]